MPSTKKTARSRKAALPAKSRGASRKTAKKTGGARKAQSSKTVKTKAGETQARRKSTAAAARSKSSAKSRTTRAAKKPARTPARKASVAAKRAAAKRRPVKTAAKQAKVAAQKRTAPVAARAPIAAKPPMAAKPPIEVKSSNAPAVKAAPAQAVSTPTVQPTAARPSARPSATTPPAANETNQVRQNLNQPVSRPAPAHQPGAQFHARAVSTARAAPPATKVVAGKPRVTSQKFGFKLSEFIVYPAHGVGQIIGIEVQEVAGFSLELFVVSFVKDKMILKVPTSKAPAVGMRKLSGQDVVEKALGTLSGRARVKRTMWSRRAQEYEAKINSGDLVTIAEVVRDLYRSESQPEQSYSERQLYEAALDRMGREIAAVRKLLDQEALALIDSFLAKAPRRGAKGEPEAVEDADVENAA